MRKLTILALALSMAAAASHSRAGQAGPAGKTISVEELTPGMRGYGFTVVEGAEPQRFEAEVVGVLRNVSPKRDAILVRLSGLSFEQSGIFGGMSGSPVYFDGRLAGAVSFGWSWQKEPVGGLTPIAQMEEAAATRPHAVRAAPSWDDLNLAGMLEGGGGPGKLRLSAEAEAVSTPAPCAPAALPILMPALSAQARQVAERLFPAGRFVLAEGAAAAPAAQAGAPSPLRAGSNVVAGLVTGDMFIGVYGTVTDVRGEEVYAFGHPFIGVDDVRIPMYNSTVLTVFPSSYMSFVIASPVEEVGAFTRDLAAGVFGRIGEKSSTFPMAVAVRRGGRTENYVYRVYRHHSLTPQLVAMVAAESATALGELPDETTLSYRLNVDYAGDRRLTASRWTVGPGAAADMAGGVGTMVLATMYNPLEYLEPESLDLEITIDPADLSARIESVAVRENEVYAGDSLQVLVRVKPVLSDAVTLELEVPVPPSLAPGRRALMICDGHTSDLLDLKEAPNRMEPRSIEEFLSLLDLPLGPRVLAARMAGAGFGLARAGREFPSLPSSALAVLSAPEETSLSPLYRSTLATLDTPYVLSGRQVVPILVKAPFEEKSE